MLHVLHHALGAPRLGEGLLAGVQQLVQLEDGVATHIRAVHHIHGEQALHGDGQIDQNADDRLQDRIILGILQERYQIRPHILTKAYGAPEGA